MDPAQVPAGGIPWSVAVWLLGGMGTAIVALGGWAAFLTKAARKERREHAAERREKDAQLEKCERRADAVERDFREHLDRSIGILAKARAGIPDRRYPTKPAGHSLEAKKRDFKNLSEVVTPEDIRRARDAADRTE